MLSVNLGIQQFFFVLEFEREREIEIVKGEREIYVQRKRVREGRDKKR